MHGDNDPYCPEGASVPYAALNLETDLIRNGGHLYPDSGYGTWPSVRDRCRDPATRLVPR